MANHTAAAASSSSSSSPVEAEPAAVFVDVIIDEEEQKQELDDDDVDGCSICLEPFSSRDPPAVTTCRHEYHLQCILEWYQRTKECPICWQILALNDPSSQELLAAVERERNARSSCHIQQVASYVDDSDFEERIIRHLAAATSRARNLNRRHRQTISGIGPSQILPSVPIAAETSNLQQINHSGEEYLSVDNILSQVQHSPIRGTHSNTSPVSMLVTAESSNANMRDCQNKPRVLLSQSPTDNSSRSSSSKFFAFKESIKSKFSVTSARCKESISKGTHGFKEKLLARNGAVKELSRGVQREMSAGIAGVARMIDRLDLSSIKTGVSVPSSTSKSTGKENGIQVNKVRSSSSRNTVEPTQDSSPDVSSLVTNIIPSHPAATLAQVFRFEA